MKKISFYGAGSDLGVHLNGASLGPKKILKNYKNKKLFVQNKIYKKSINKYDLKKNLNEVNKFNNELSHCFNIINF